MNTKDLNLKEIDWLEIVHQLQERATSLQAKEQLGQLSPLLNSTLAEQSFQQILEFTPPQNEGLRPSMESLDLFFIWFTRLQKKATLKPLELRDLRSFLLEVLALQEVLSTYETPYINELRSQSLEAEHPLSAIDQILTPGGDIRTDASEKLHQLFKEKNNSTAQLQKTLDRLVKKHEMESILQDKYVTTREGRWVIPVKSGMRHDIDGIIHASSQSKQTVFVEPQEVVALNNRIRQIENEIEEEVERLLLELSQYLQTLISDFQNTYNILLDVDVLWAKTDLCATLKAHPVKFDSYNLELKELRHPVLSLQLNQVIPNDVSLNQKHRILLISGPNAGGKTVLLKSIGLAARMAQCGLLICAEPGSSIPFFTDIMIAVGDSQSVEENLSTFAAHLKILNSSIEAQGPEHLILIDEICGSTDPEEGAALARAFIETYSENKVYGVITSHLSALKTNWAPDSGVQNGSLEFSPEKGPTYQFLMGIPGQSLAITTAQRIGVQEKIIEKALKSLSPDQKAFQDRLAEADKIREDLQHIRSEMVQQRNLAQKEKIEYEKLKKEIQQNKENTLNKVYKEAIHKVDNLIQESLVDQTFRRHENLAKVKEQLPEVVKVSPTNTSTEEMTVTQFSHKFPAGTKVYASSLGRDAVVQGAPNSRGEVLVLSNSMRVSVPWKSLLPSRTHKTATKEILRKTTHFQHAHIDNDRVVDVRGRTIEDAVSLLEIQLDTAALNQEDRVKVVHGHGTEALKRAIRGYLSRSLYVKKWQAGNKHNGGDGVTWIEL